MRDRPVHATDGIIKALCSPYRAGRSKDWIKVENRAHPAMDREL
jgi:ATP-dependent DNA ligase